MSLYTFERPLLHTLEIRKSPLLECGYARSSRRSRRATLVGDQAPHNALHPSMVTSSRSTQDLPHVVLLLLLLLDVLSTRASGRCSELSGLTTALIPFSHSVTLAARFRNRRNATRLVDHHLHRDRRRFCSCALRPRLLLGNDLGAAAHRRRRLTSCSDTMQRGSMLAFQVSAQHHILSTDTNYYATVAELLAAPIPAPLALTATSAMLSWLPISPRRSRHATHTANRLRASSDSYLWLNA